MAWLRNNVLAGVVTAALISSLAAAWAMPARIADVEFATQQIRERHEADVTVISARHEIDLVAVAGHQRASERVDATVIEMIRTVQSQITSVQHLVEAQIALEAERQGRVARRAPDEGEGG